MIAHFRGRQLLCNKYKGVMASYWLFPGINTGLLSHITLRERVHICESRRVITHFPSLIHPFLTVNLIHLTQKTFSLLDPSGCLSQECVIKFHALTSPYMDVVCTCIYQWKSYNSYCSTRCPAPGVCTVQETPHTVYKHTLLLKAPSNHFTGSWSVKTELQ